MIGVYIAESSTRTDCFAVIGKGLLDRTVVVANSDSGNNNLISLGGSTIGKLEEAA